MRTRPSPCCTSDHKSQHGSALLIILTIIGIGAAFLLVSALNKANSQIGRDKITAAALAQAKEALIGYAASVTFGTGCGANCARPGELPCPDNWPQGSANEGTPTTPCNGNAIGRLPWKTLRLPDLRDASGERLWYAVSTSYKNNSRVFPLNSDTLGTISVRDTNGALLADATSGTGVAAIVISPGGALTRQDGTIQNRNAAGYNNPINYLDNINAGEDNQNFVNGTTNGFIQGPIKNASNSVILNDTLITLSRDDIMRVTEKRVAGEIINVLTLPYPAPADFSDINCLGQAAIPTLLCGSGIGNRGRIPANPLTAWIGNAVFLNGVANDNWFQQNAWREVIYYTTGYLTVNNPPGAPITGRQALILMTGSALTAQTRTTNALKGAESNYLEDENFTPLDNTYTLRPAIAITPFNDKPRCLPASPPNC